MPSRGCPLRCSGASFARSVRGAGFLEAERLRRGEAPASPETAAPLATARLAVKTCNCDRATFKARDPVGHLESDLVRLPLVVGNRKPGDRMRALGLPR